MIDILIENGKIVTPDGTVDGSISVKDGKIFEISKNHQDMPIKKIIDAKGKYIIPGLVDHHVHFGLRNPNNMIDTIKSEWEPESRAAIHGGVTTAILMLCTKKSYIDLIHEIKQCSAKSSYIDYGFSVVIQGENHLDEMDNLYEMGISSFKHFFTAFKGKEGEQIGLNCCDEELFCRSLEKIRNYGKPAIAMVHAEDSGLYSYFMNKIKSSGRNGLEAWADARPNICEYLRVGFAAEIALHLKAPIHFVHISTKESVDILKAYKEKGADISGEVVPHTLAVSKYKDKEVGVWGKFVPPLRGYEDIDKLWDALDKDIISHVATDHCCYSKEEKEMGMGKHGDIWKVPPGISNVLEHNLPVMITYGVKKGRISIERLVKVCCENNAKRFGMYPRKGALIPGADADIVILDTNKESIVDESFYHGKNPEISIHKGEILFGKPEYVFLGGKIVVEEGKTVEKPGCGKYVSACVK